MENYGRVCGAIKAKTSRTQSTVGNPAGDPRLLETLRLSKDLLMINSTNYNNLK